MKQSFAAALFLFVILVWAPTGWGQQVSAYHCVLATQLGTHVTYYSSDVIHIHADAVEFSVLAAAWNSYVRANYPIGNPQDKGSCNILGGSEDYPSYPSTWERGYTVRGATAIHVDWKYTPAPAATPAAAPPASNPSTTMQHRINPSPAPAQPPMPAPPPHAASPSSAQEKAYHCIFDAWQGQKSIRYSSGPIPTDAPVSSLNDAWTNEVRATYHINDPKRRGGCQIMNGIAANRDRAVNSIEQSYKTHGIEVIHVNWTSAPGQVAVAPSPPPAPAHIIAAPAPAPASAPQPAPAHATTAIATPAPAPQQSALAQYPEASQLAEPFRTRAIQEVSNTKRYCQNNVIVSGMFDCDCFAKMILHQRIAHASEYRVVPSASQDTGGWEPLENLYYSDKLPCTECISDARLTKYAADESRKSLVSVIAQKGASDPAVTNTISCTATKFVADFRAKPYIGLAQGALNTAFSSCGKQYGH